MCCAVSDHSTVVRRIHSTPAAGSLLTWSWLLSRFLPSPTRESRSVSSPIQPATDMMPFAASAARIPQVDPEVPCFDRANPCQLSCS